MKQKLYHNIFDRLCCKVWSMRWGIVIVENDVMIKLVCLSMPTAFIFFCKFQINRYMTSNIFVRISTIDLFLFYKLNLKELEYIYVCTCSLHLIKYAILFKMPQAIYPNIGYLNYHSCHGKGCNLISNEQ